MILKLKLSILVDAKGATRLKVSAHEVLLENEANIIMNLNNVSK